MKCLMFFISILAFGSQAFGQNEIRYRTIQQLKAAGQVQLTCKSSSNNPQTNVSFRFGFGALRDSLSLAVIWPNESMWVREVKSDPTYPVWSREYGTTDFVSFTGNSIPTNETATLKIEQGSGGRFKLTMSYIHRVTGERIDISNLRCYAANYTRVLGQ